MDEADHALTASYGISIAQRDTAGAIYMVIQDVQGLFGSKCHETIYQMLDSMK